MCHLETHHDEAERPLNFLPYFLRSFCGLFEKEARPLFSKSTNGRRVGCGRV